MSRRVHMSLDEFEKLEDLLPEAQRFQIEVNGVIVGNHEVIFRPTRNMSTGEVVFAWGVDIGGVNVIVGDGAHLRLSYPPTIEPQA